MSYHPSNMMYSDLSVCEVRDLIARRAYELYKQRDGEIGDDLSDWLKAEGEVVSILLAEPQKTAEKETLNLSTANRTRTAKSAPKAANGGPRVSRWSKRKNALKANPA